MPNLNAWESKIQPRLDQIEAWARNGVSMRDIAHNLGLCDKTLTRWRQIKPELDEILSRSAAYVDDVIVESAYLKRIVGYDVDEVRREYRVETLDDGTEVRILTKEIHQQRHIPADPRGAEWWLAHRKPSVWADQASDDAATMPGIVIMPEPDADLLNGNGVEVGTGGGSDGHTQ